LGIDQATVHQDKRVPISSIVVPGPHRPELRVLPIGIAHLLIDSQRVQLPRTADSQGVLH
jgi:hypothetical protein